MKTLFFVLCSTPPPCCRAARMCVWAVPSLVRGATLLPLLLPPRRVWRIAAGWWVGAKPLRLTHQPTRKISLPEIYMCAPTKDGSLTRPSLKHNTHIFTQSTVSHNGMSRCIPQKFLFSACVGGDPKSRSTLLAQNSFTHSLTPRVAKSFDCAMDTLMLDHRCVDA